MKKTEVNEALRQQKFDTDEAKGRAIFQAQLKKNHNKISNYFFTPILAHYDVLYTGVTGAEYVVEIKYRENYASSATTITKDGVMLEKYKYDSIMEKVKDGYIPIYISYFNDGISATHLLSQNPSDYVWQWKLLPKYTAVDGGSVWKLVTMIPLNNCVKKDYTKCLSYLG